MERAQTRSGSGHCDAVGQGRVHIALLQHLQAGRRVRGIRLLSASCRRGRNHGDATRQVRGIRLQVGSTRIGRAEVSLIAVVSPSFFTLCSKKFTSGATRQIQVVCGRHIGVYDVTCA